jgi:serine/threonine-protein kinase
VNSSADANNEFLSDGITEDLIIALSRLKELRVAARTSSFAFKAKNNDIRRIGELLNVETVLEGSVRRSGNMLRVTAQLVNARDGFHLWSERYDREMKDVFDIQDEISRSIVSALKVQLVGRAEAQLVRRPTTNANAYELYAKARVLWNLRGPGLRKALHYFDLALLEDPECAPARSGVADCCALLAVYDLLPWEDALDKASVAARHAVACDDQSAEAHCSLGWVLQNCDWSISNAERAFARALELNPNYTPARYWYAVNLLLQGRHLEVLRQAERGVDGDPLSGFAHAALGWMHMVQRHYEAALPPLRRCLELDPAFAVARWLMGRTLWMIGDRTGALSELQRADDLSEGIPTMVASLAWALALSTNTGRAREILRQLTERTSPVRTRQCVLAIVHAGLGENDLAFAMLEHALETRELGVLWLAATPQGLIELIPLEKDPRWPTFRAKVQAAVWGASRERESDRLVE